MTSAYPQCTSINPSTGSRCVFGHGHEVDYHAHYPERWTGPATIGPVEALVLEAWGVGIRIGTDVPAQQAKLVDLLDCARRAQEATAAAVQAEREACAVLCETEANACDYHAKGLKGRGRIAVSSAHSMCAQQNRACAHYIRTRGERKP